MLQMRKELPKTSEIDRLAEVAAETVTSAEVTTCTDLLHDTCKDRGLFPWKMKGRTFHFFKGKALGLKKVVHHRSFVTAAPG